MRTTLKVLCVLLALFVATVKYVESWDSPLESVRRNSTLVVKSEKTIRTERLEAFIDSFVDENPGENLRFEYRDSKFAMYTIVTSR